MSKPAAIEFTVRVMEDGETKFDSGVTMPLTGVSQDDMRNAAKAWVDLMEAGIRFSQAVKGAPP